jgi:hypothetical protein
VRLIINNKPWLSLKKLNYDFSKVTARVLKRKKKIISANSGGAGTRGLIAAKTKT